MALPLTKNELMRTIDEAWTEFQAFLGSLTEKDTLRKDENDWTVKDHITHLTVWEDSVAVLFRGGKRHEALGIDESFYHTASFDQINAIIRERHAHLHLSETTTLLKRVHQALMLDVDALSEVQLATTVRDFFPQAPREDERTMIDFIYWNTADHFREHLPWMLALTTQSL
jgi:hypothetical protein